MNNKVYSIQVADAIRIKACKQTFKGNLLFSDNDELFYERSKEQYVYVFKYGIICFYNIERKEIEAIISELLPHVIGALDDQFSEEIEIITGGEVANFSFDGIKIPELSIDSLRLIMLNVSQSVALDRYAEKIEHILEDTNVHTSYMEAKGKLDISGNKLRRYIGKILNVKNTIAEHLYIFDSHDVTWGDETLNILDQNLKKTFDLKDRYRSLQDQIEIIKENLELFKDIMHHRQSSILEWIIIILILVEVIDMFILKFL